MTHHLKQTNLSGIVAAMVVAAALSACNTSSETPAAGAGDSAQGVPRAADGKPNFNGVWAGPGFRHTGKEVDSATVRRYTEKNMTAVKASGQALFNRPHANDVRVDDPTAVCLPNGLTRQIPALYAQQWIQTPDQLVILYEYMHFFRVIPIGAPNRPHGEIAEPTYMGDSIAWWEDDTLVIDTIGLNEWLLDATHGEDGSSRWHSDQMHVVERIRFTDPANASYDVTLNDPGVFEGPWTENWAMERKPNWKILEFICDDNDRCRGGNCVDADVQKSSTQ